MNPVRVVVHGRVQGVGFRWFVRENARRLGLAGWVRNMPDGSVEAVVGGVPGLVDRLIAAMTSGPESADVSGVETTAYAAGEPLPFPFAVHK